MRALLGPWQRGLGLKSEEKLVNIEEYKYKSKMPVRLSLKYSTIKF